MQTAPEKRSRADLPRPVGSEKDFTAPMMSDTSASVSDPSQCVKHVAPLPEEDVVRGCYAAVINITVYATAAEQELHPAPSRPWRDSSLQQEVRADQRRR